MLLFGKWASTHPQEIAKAQKWIDSAQSQFAQAVEEAGLAEKHFEEIAGKKEAELEKIMAELNEATIKAKKASEFKEKIQSFIHN